MEGGRHIHYTPLGAPQLCVYSRETFGRSDFDFETFHSTTCTRANTYTRVEMLDFFFFSMLDSGARFLTRL